MSPSYVIIPDLFQSFMADTPNVNPHYLEVKQESEMWVYKYLNADEKLQKQVRRTDFAWFCAIAAPTASKQRLRLLCDWGNWVFIFDDLFDNGVLRNDLGSAQMLIDSLLSSTRGEYPMINTPVIEMHDSIWMRLTQTASNGTQRKYAAAMEDYCNGILGHYDHLLEEPTVKYYLSTRRKAVGVAPMISLVEYAQGLHIHKNSHSTMLRTMAIDVISIQNDILSYFKEKVEGVPHNIIVVLEQNMNTQNAFDEAGHMLDEYYQCLDGVDEAARNVMIASLHWSFRSKRYFGGREDLVRKTRRVEMP